MEAPLEKYLSFSPTGLFFGGFMKFLKRFFALLGNQRGEVGDGPDPTPGPEKVGGGKEAEGASDGDGKAPPQESFIDPGSLPEELRPHWKRMHGTFSREMGKIKESKKKIEDYDRFMSDPEYAKQTILAYASRLGLTVTEAQAAAQYAASTSTVSPVKTADVPSELVQAVKERLAPELQWMADSIASAHWAANKMTLAPIVRRFEEDRKERVDKDYEELAEELSLKVPGWEDKEEEMDGMLAFLENKSHFRHPTYGSKLELLYNLVTGNTRATQEAINRFSHAARNRSGIGSAGRQSTPDISEKVVKAKTEQEAWDIAADAALKTVGQK